MAAPARRQPHKLRPLGRQMTTFLVGGGPVDREDFEAAIAAVWPGTGDSARLRLDGVGSWILWAVPGFYPFIYLRQPERVQAAPYLTVVHSWPVPSEGDHDG